MKLRVTPPCPAILYTAIFEPKGAAKKKGKTHSYRSSSGMISVETVDYEKKRRPVIGVPGLLADRRESFLVRNRDPFPR